MIEFVFFDDFSPGLRADPSTRARQSNVANKSDLHVRPQPNSAANRQSNGHAINRPQQQPDYSNLTDAEELHARLAANDPRGSAYDGTNGDFIDDSDDHATNPDIADLHGRINPTDMERLYSRLPADVLPVADDVDVLNPDQQQLHARVIGAGLADQGFHDD